MTRWLAVIAALAPACGGAPSSSPAAEPRPAQLPPPPPSCAQVANQVFVLIEPKDDHARRVSDLFQLRCADDAWAADARACIVATTSLEDPRHCKAKLSPDQRRLLEDGLADADRVARLRRVPTACEQYAQVMEQVGFCDQIPQATRDALQQAFDAMRSSWEAHAGITAEAHASSEHSCKLAVETLRDALAGVCGW